MQKISVHMIFIFLALSWSIIMSFASTETTIVSWWPSTGITDCWFTSAHSVLHRWVPQTNTLTSPSFWSTQCLAHTYYSWADYTKTFLYNTWITSCNTWDRVLNITPDPCISWTCTITCRKWDDVAPSESDILSVSPVNNASLLATNNHPITYTISDNGDSPIIKIAYQYEDWNTLNNLSAAQELNWNIRTWNLDVRNVDNLRWTQWYRKYTHKINEICDAAWNCWSTPWAVYWLNVYANTSHLIWGGTKEADVNSLISWLAIADGSELPLYITLLDTYGNEVVPAPGINRKVSFDINTVNTLTLNQYNSTGSPSSVYIKSNWVPSVYNVPVSMNDSKIFTDQQSNNGQYELAFQAYSPTENSHTSLVWTNQEIILNSVKLNITDTLWGYVSSAFINNSTGVNLKIKPLYTTEFNNWIKENGFIEWVTQDTNIDVFTGSLISVTQWKLYLEFGKQDIANNIEQEDFNLSPIFTWSLEWQQVWSNSYIDLYNVWLVDQRIETLLSQEKRSIANVEDSYLAMIIEYMIDGKLVVYPGDIIWKDSYFWWTIWNNTNQVGVKIKWNTFSNDQQDIILNQSWTRNDIKIVTWDTSKALVRKNINEELAEKIRNLWKLDRVPINLVDSNILYIYLTGWNISYSDSMLKGNMQGWRTVVIEWWDLVIDEDINISQSIGVVVIKDKNWNWWNVLIDDDVKNIKAFIYADKSLLPYSDEVWNKKILEKTDWIGYFKNQLYIEWAVFSNNTIWGSRKIPAVCPYFVDDSVCDIEEAQKYDLNFLRRYYRLSGIDNNGDGEDDVANWWLSSMWLSWGDLNYPLVIKYNPKVQLNPPALFGNN